MRDINEITIPMKGENMRERLSDYGNEASKLVELQTVKKCIQVIAYHGILGDPVEIKLVLNLIERLKEEFDLNHESVRGA